MSYKTEFTDYPESDMPEIPAGFVDSSWRNDACPSFYDAARGLVLSVDYADPDKREHPETPRFLLSKADSEGLATDDFCASDSWEEIAREIAESLSANDGTLDSFVLEYCEKRGIQTEGNDSGGIFGIYFSGAEVFTRAEAESLICKAADAFRMWKSHAWRVTLSTGAVLWLGDESSVDSLIEAGLETGITAMAHYVPHGGAPMADSFEVAACLAGWVRLDSAMFINRKGARWTESGGGGGNMWRALCEVHGIKA